MAENTKTYTAKFDIETEEAVKKLKVLTQNVKTSVGEFETVTEAIGKLEDNLRKLDVKSDEFKKLSKELQRFRDQQRDADIASKRFTEALAAQPGVIGFVGQSLEGLRNTIRIFAANPLIAVLAGITGGLLALRESLTRTEEGQEKLNKISESFTKILNGLFAVIEPIATQLADLVISLLENEKVMDGLSKTVGVLTGTFTGLLGVIMSINKFIVGQLINGFTTLINVAKGAGDVLAGVFTFDWDRIKEGANSAFEALKEGVTTTVDNVKDLGTGIVDSVVDGFETGETAFREGFQRLTDTEKELEEKAEEERKKREEERLKKEEEDRKKREEERLKTLEEAQKIQRETELALLEEQQRELILREEKFQNELRKLKEAGFTDFTQLEELYNKDVDAINQKYEDQRLAKEAEDKAKEAEEKQFQLEQRILENETQLEFEAETAQQRLDLLKEQEQLVLSQADLTEAERTRIKAEYAQRRTEIEDEERQKDLENEEKKAEAKLLIEQNVFNAVGNLVDQNSAAGKGLAIAQAIINTFKGANAALGAYPPPFNFIAAASVVAAGLANIRKIRQTEIPSVTGKGNVTGGRSTGGTLPTAPSIPAITPPQITQPQQPVNTGEQIARSLRQQPVKAFVVGSDITSQQQLDRRTQVAATF